MADLGRGRTGIGHTAKVNNLVLCSTGVTSTERCIELLSSRFLFAGNQTGIGIDGTYIDGQHSGERNPPVVAGRAQASHLIDLPTPASSSLGSSRRGRGRPAGTRNFMRVKVVRLLGIPATQRSVELLRRAPLR